MPGLGVTAVTGAAATADIFALLGLPRSGCILLLTGGVWTLASGVVATWTDQSGNSNDVTQGTAVSRPAVTSMGTNAIPAASFDGINDYLRRAAGSFQVPSPLSIVVAGFATGTIQPFCDTATATVRAIPYVLSSTVIGFSGLTGQILSTGSQSISTAKMLVAIGDGASSQMWLNGVQIASGMMVGEGLNGLTMGATYDLGASMTGAVAIFAVYSRALSSGEIAAATTGIRAYVGI